MKCTLLLKKIYLFVQFSEKLENQKKKFEEELKNKNKIISENKNKIEEDIKKINNF
jgi:predicted nuclease with TOPRIM domain